MTFRRADAFTLLELLVVLAVISIVAAVAIPSLLSARLRANEAAAFATLRFVADAQARFQATGLVDLDRDGAGEYGYLKELSAGSGVRTSPNGSASGAFAAPAPLPPAFAALEAGGEFVRSGYRFRIFLPGAGGVGVGESESFPLAADVDAKLASTSWCCYAWPTRHGTSGNRTFFVDQEASVVATECDEYSGPGGFACGAAFSRGPGGLSSITGAVAAGTRGRDGNMWRRVF